MVKLLIWSDPNHKSHDHLTQPGFLKLLCWSQLRILMFRLCKGLNALIPCLHPCCMCYKRTCAVNTDTGLYVHLMPFGWSSFDTHEAVAVFQRNTMISKFQAVSTVFPGYSSIVIHGSRLKSSFKTGHHNVVGCPLPALHKNMTIMYLNIRYKSEWTHLQKHLKNHQAFKWWHQHISD